MSISKRASALCKPTQWKRARVKFYLTWKITNTRMVHYIGRARVYIVASIYDLFVQSNSVFGEPREMINKIKKKKKL